jgi:hypothetical protein
LTDISSTSKISVAFGPMSRPAPRSPYARFGGTNSWYLPPSFISWSPSVQPGMTPETGNVAVWPRLYELSNSVPLTRVPL